MFSTANISRYTVATLQLRTYYYYGKVTSSYLYYFICKVATLNCLCKYIATVYSYVWSIEYIDTNTSIYHDIRYIDVT